MKNLRRGQRVWCVWFGAPGVYEATIVEESSDSAWRITNPKNETYSLQDEQVFETREDAERFCALVVLRGSYSP